MEIKMLTQDFSVCKVRDYSQVDMQSAFFFLGRTDEENSLVCLTEAVPGNVLEREDGWKAFRIQGVLDFSLIGILSGISAVLADNGIGIFAISTFQTDYILTKAANFERAADALRGNGYTIVSGNHGK